MCVQSFCKPTGEGQVLCGPEVRAIGGEVTRPRGGTSHEAEPRSLAASWEILARLLGLSLLRSFSQ